LNKFKLKNEDLLKIVAKTGTTGTFRGFSQSLLKTVNSISYYIIFLN